MGLFGGGRPSEKEVFASIYEIQRLSREIYHCQHWIKHYIDEMSKCKSFEIQLRKRIMELKELSEQHKALEEAQAKINEEKRALAEIERYFHLSMVKTHEQKRHIERLRQAV